MQSMLSILAVSFSALALSVTGAAAQFSLDEIEANVGSLSDEMTRVDALLGDADPNKRLAAMDMLIRSGNVDYAARAKEVGLFSSDKQMQRRALAAIFDAGGPFRIDVLLQGLDEDKTRAREFVKGQDGSFRDNDTVGSVLLYTGEYSAELACWPVRKRSECAITPTGDHYIVSGYYAFTGSFSLNAEAALTGSANYYNRDTFPIRVNLVE